METKLLKNFFAGTTSKYMPILENLKIENGRIFLNTLEDQLEIYSKEISCDKPFLLNAKKLFKFDQFKIENGKAISGNFSINKSDILSEDYPAEFNVKKEKFFRFESTEKFKECIDKIEHDVSDDETRLQLNGFNYNGVDLTATNGHSLSTVKIFSEGFGEIKDFSPIITKRILKVINLIPASAKITVFEKFTVIEWEEKNEKIILTYKNIDGIFPDFKRVIPSKEIMHKFKMPEIKNAVKECARILSSGNSCKKMNVKIENKKMKISASFEGINFEESFDCESEVLEAVEINLSFKLLLDLLSNIKIKFIYIKDKGPILFEGYEREISVIMPLRD